MGSAIYNILYTVYGYSDCTPLIRKSKRHPSLEAVILLALLLALIFSFFADSCVLTPMDVAISKGFFDIAALLEVSQSTADLLHVALHLAASKGHATVVQTLLDSRPDLNVNAKDWKKQTALMIASSNGDVDVVHALSTRSDLDVTAAIAGSQQQYISEFYADVIALVLLGRAEGNVNASGEKTPTEMGQMAMEIMRIYPDCGFVDDGRWSILRMASHLGHTAVVQHLLDNPALVFKGSGSAALWQATRDGQAAVVKLILSREDADVNARTITNDTALTMAASRPWHAEVGKVLLGAPELNVNAKNISGERGGGRKIYLRRHPKKP